MTRNFAMVFALLLAVPAGANPPLPGIVARDMPGLSLHGATTFRFFGMRVYDIRLWAPGGNYSPGKSFALELQYDMNFKGAEIAKRSIDEMREQGYGPEDKLERWRAAMAKVFPDIKPGDTLIGVATPGQDARFYTREKFLASIPEAEFSKAFFDIWLSPKTTEPDMTKRLLSKK